MFFKYPAYDRLWISQLVRIVAPMTKKNLEKEKKNCMCHLSHVTCYVSCVKCHMPPLLIPPLCTIRWLTKRYPPPSPKKHQNTKKN